MAYYLYEIEGGEVVFGGNNVNNLIPQLNNNRGMIYEDGDVRDWRYLKVVDNALAVDTEEWSRDRLAERNARLRDSDYTQLRDVNLTNNTEWVSYRQQLRAIEDQPGFPETVTYPDLPTVER